MTMDTLGINLLPWREKRHQQQCYALYGKLALLTCALIVLWLWTAQSTDNMRNQITENQTQLRQIQTEISEKSNTIKLLQQEYSDHKRQFNVPNHDSLQMLIILSQLPLQKGELSSFALEPIDNDNIQLSIKGYALSQQEFEQINQFLQAQPGLKSLQLTEFEPQPQGYLIFNFSLLFEAKQEENTP